jgi:hypothetical protein
MLIMLSRYRQSISSANKRKETKQNKNLRINWERRDGQIGCPGLPISLMNFSPILDVRFQSNETNRPNKNLAAHYFLSSSP